MGDKYKPRMDRPVFSTDPRREHGRYATLDLHGRKVEEVENLVVDFISQNQTGGTTTLEIVHGHGTGAIRKELIKILTRLKKPEGAAYELTIIDFRQQSASILVDL